MASVARRPDGQWRARYRDAAGREHSKHFGRKVDAQRWLDETTAAIKVKTMLGQKFVAVDPLGTGSLAGPIPLERTTTPYTLNTALQDLGENASELDKPRFELAHLRGQRGLIALGDIGRVADDRVEVRHLWNRIEPP